MSWASEAGKTLLQKAADKARKEAEALAAKASTQAEADAAAAAMADAQKKEYEAASAAALQLFNQEITNQAKAYAAEAMQAQQQADTQEELDYWKNQAATYQDIANTPVESKNNGKYVVFAGLAILAMLFLRR